MIVYIPRLDHLLVLSVASTEHVIDHVIILTIRPLTRNLFCFLFFFRLNSLAYLMSTV